MCNRWLIIDTYECILEVSIGRSLMAWHYKKRSVCGAKKSHRQNEDPFALGIGGCRSLWANQICGVNSWTFFSVEPKNNNKKKITLCGANIQDGKEYLSPHFSSDKVIRLTPANDEQVTIIKELGQKVQVKCKLLFIIENIVYFIRFIHILHRRPEQQD